MADNLLFKMTALNSGDFNLDIILATGHIALTFKILHKRVVKNYKRTYDDDGNI